MKFLQFVSPSFLSASAGVLALGMASWLGDSDDGGSEGDGDFDLDDDFGMDDGFDDDFGSFDDGDGGSDSSVTELENRIEDMEHEIANVSSKANTVRSENEQISDSVEDVEENVRKLLEIYEMVTRGVNPFVDDVNAGALGGDEADAAGSFGLFDDEDEPVEEEDDLDEDIANADATEFFDDDALDDFEEFDDEDDLDGFGAEDDGDVDETVDGDGTSFEELKAEYDAGEADWADDGFEDEDAEIDVEGDVDAPVDDPASDAAELFEDDDLAADSELIGASERDDVVQGSGLPEDDGTDAGVAEPAAATGFQFGTPSGTDEDEDPHLAEPPTGYLADVLLLEWLSYLLDEFGTRNTVRALNYYQRIGWISEPVRVVLFEFLEGLTDLDHLYRDEFGRTDLTMDDHLRCLEYIDELASDDVGRAVVERYEDLNTNGIQR